MVSRLEALNEEAHRQTRKLLVQQYDTERVLDITAGIEMLAVSSVEEAMLRNDIQASIIESIRYPTMTNRYEDIDEAFPETFEWAFRDSTNNQLPWSNLAEWLRNGEGVYWINGKAGLGKSTLMKHIFDDQRTRRYLQD